MPTKVSERGSALRLLVALVGAASLWPQPETQLHQTHEQFMGDLLDLTMKERGEDATWRDGVGSRREEF